MGDYESRLYDVQLDLNSLVDRINRCDPSLCSTDWYGLTYHYDFGFIELMYQGIEDEEMLNMVTDLISSEHERLLLEGKINQELDPVSGYPVSEDLFREKLELFADRRRELLNARRNEQEIRRRYEQQLYERMQKAWEITKKAEANVSVHYYPDGVPDVDSYYDSMAEEVGDILRENEELVKRLGEKEQEIKQLKSEKAKKFNDLSKIYREGVWGGKTENSDKRIKELEEELQAYKENCKTLELRLEKIESETIQAGDIDIAEKRKIDVIKILHAMCNIGVFQLKNGKDFTIEAVMKFFGKILNNNFTEYNSNLSTSKSKTKEVSYMQVFDDLRKAANDYFKKS